MTDFGLQICNLPRITEFALKFRINSQSLSQSESSNFSQCVIIGENANEIFNDLCTIC